MNLTIGPDPRCIKSLFFTNMFHIISMFELQRADMHHLIPALKATYWRKCQEWNVVCFLFSLHSVSPYIIMNQFPSATSSIAATDWVVWRQKPQSWWTPSNGCDSQGPPPLRKPWFISLFLQSSRPSNYCVLFTGDASPLFFSLLSHSLPSSRILAAWVRKSVQRSEC